MCSCNPRGPPPGEVSCELCGHPISAHATEPATSPASGCSQCGCTAFDGPGDGRFCRACGHTRDAHITAPTAGSHGAADETTPEIVAANGCNQCECGGFDGPADGRFCMSCGHPRDAHHGDASPVSGGQARASVPAAPVEPADALARPGCSQCDCSGFDGPAVGVYCIACGHARDAHLSAPRSASSPSQPVALA